MFLKSDRWLMAKRSIGFNFRYFMRWTQLFKGTRLQGAFRSSCYIHICPRSGSWDEEKENGRKEGGDSANSWPRSILGMFVVALLSTYLSAFHVCVKTVLVRLLSSFLITQCSFLESGNIGPHGLYVWTNLCPEYCQSLQNYYIDAKTKLRS